MAVLRKRKPFGFVLHSNSFGLLNPQIIMNIMHILDDCNQKIFRTISEKKSDSFKISFSFITSKCKSRNIIIPASMSDEELLTLYVAKFGGSLFCNQIGVIIFLLNYGLLELESYCNVYFYTLFMY